MNEKISRYPLQWPVGWKRTATADRSFGRFGVSRQGPGQNYRHKQDVTVYESVGRLLTELGRMGIGLDDIVVSTNVPTRLDGMPRSDAKRPEDPGAAVYWVDKAGNRRCMAIDQYTKVEMNIAALAATLDAMRAIERHGGGEILDRAFTGFAALPAPIAAGMKRPWREVLGVGSAPVDAASVQAKWRLLAMTHHPDRGGDPAKMAELNTARDEALKEIQP